MNLTLLIKSLLLIRSNINYNDFDDVGGINNDVDDDANDQ